LYSCRLLSTSGMRPPHASTLFPYTTLFRSREAGLAGDWLRGNVPPIEHVLCSSATRTRQTLDRTGVSAPVSFSDRLYGATPGTMIDEINQVLDEVSTLLVIGHEPTVSQVSLGLAGPETSDPDAAGQIAMKFPTSGIA